MWVKRKVREETDFDQFSQFQENLNDPYEDIDFSQMSAIKSRRNHDDHLEMDSNRLNQSQSINMGHFQSQLIEPSIDDRDNKNNLIRGSTIVKDNQKHINFKGSGGKINSPQVKEDLNDGARVQVISDFDSQDNDDDKYSIEVTSQKDLARINENIQLIQSSKVANNGSKDINYDLLGVSNPKHMLHSKINKLIEKEFSMKDRRT